MIVKMYECPYCAQDAVFKDDSEKDSWYPENEIAEHMVASHGQTRRTLDRLEREWSCLGILTTKEVDKVDTNRRVV